MPSTSEPSTAAASDVGATDGRADGPLVETRGLVKHFTLGGGIVASLLGRRARVIKAVDGVDLTIGRREVVGLVGESGSGKSTLGMTLVKLYQPTAGTMSFQGRDTTHLKASALKAYRRSAQIIFQDPYGSLNPRLSVAQLVEEPLKVHGVRNKQERGIRVVQALERVRVPPAQYLNRFPHELSGGQRQRIAIARAVVLEPEFIVADEPVSMLDVSVQASILELLELLSAELGLAVLYVSHDIATVRYICDRVAVMYLGKFVEYGDTEKVTANPQHPYTRRLMAAVPSVDPNRKRARITGDEPLIPPTGQSCAHPEPHWIQVEPDHQVACHLHTAESRSA